LKGTDWEAFKRVVTLYIAGDTGLVSRVIGVPQGGLYCLQHCQAFTGKFT
jgi:hypothetical protein